MEVIPLFRVNIENGCPAFPALPSNYHLSWPNITLLYCLPGKCISECFIECFGWMEIVRSVPSALIILTWKRDSHPTLQGSLTPGKLDLVFLIHDLHRSTKDLTSPVSAEAADGNWNFTWLRLRLFSHKPLKSQQLEPGGKNELYDFYERVLSSRTLTLTKSF